MVVKRRILGLTLLAGALCDMFAWAPWLHGFSAACVLLLGVAFAFSTPPVRAVDQDSYEAGYLRALRDMRAALFTEALTCRSLS